MVTSSNPTRMVNGIQSRRSSVCVWELRPLNLVTKNSLFCPVSPQSEQLHFTTRGRTEGGREGEIAAAERLNNSFGFRQANQTSLSLPPSDCRRTKGDVWKEEEEEVVDREEATGGTLELDFKNSRV